MKNSHLRRFIRIMAVALLAITFLSGCWDTKELGNLAIVMAVAIDQADQPGKVVVTVQIIKPGEVRSGGGGGGEEGGSQQKGGSKQAYLVISSTGRTVAEAFRNFSFRLNRELYLSDNQIIIIGKDIAKKGVRPLLDYFNRTREPRETAWILVADGKAGDILESRVQVEKILAIEITRLITNRTFTSQIGGLMQINFVNLLLSKTASPYATFVDVTGETKEVQLIGTAVFKHDQFVGHLDRFETRGFLWVIGKVARGLITVRLPGGGEVDCGIIRTKSKVTPELLSGEPMIHLEVDGQFGVVNNPALKDYTKVENTKQLEKTLRRAIRREITQALSKVHQLDSDIFGFGEMIHRKYPKQWKSLQPDWERKFPSCPVQLKIKATIVEIGLNFKPTVPQ